MKQDSITNRFKDKNFRLSYFEDEIVVACPKCHLKAVILKQNPSSYFSERILKCNNCFYHQIGRRQTFRVELNCSCGHCAKPIKVIFKNVVEKKEKILVKCPGCGKTESYEPRNIPQQWIFKNTGTTIDKYFGLPLWLTDNFKGNDLWAFNYEHLAYLKQYISAGLRERNNRSHWTLVEKLPEWMKSGKNRENLIKIITELESK